MADAAGTRALIRDRLLNDGPVPKVAILGRGASAAYAYRACVYAGVTPAVYGPETRQQKGAFWMHWMPPHLDESKPAGATREGAMHSDQIKVTGRGTAEEYVYKQWGRKNIPSSFREGDINTQGYDPARALELLWQDFAGAVDTVQLTDEAIVKLARQYDLVLMTFPRTVPLGAAPTPVKIPIIWKKYAYKPDPTRINNMVVYNGVPGNIVRSSWLWGVESHECLAKTDPGYFDPWLDEGYGVEWRTDLHPDTKQGFAAPLAENVTYLGRYANWSRKMLSYEAYGSTMQILREWVRLRPRMSS